MQTNHSCRAERWRQTVRPKNLKIFPIWPLQKRLGDPSITNRGLDMRHNDRHMGSDSKNPKQAMNLPDYVLGRTMYTQAHVHTKELSETCPLHRRVWAAIYGTHTCSHPCGKAWEETQDLVPAAPGRGAGVRGALVLPLDPITMFGLAHLHDSLPKNVFKEEYEGRKPALFGISSAKSQGGEEAAGPIMMR